MTRWSKTTGRVDSRIELGGDVSVLCRQNLGDI